MPRDGDEPGTLQIRNPRSADERPTPNSNRTQRGSFTVDPLDRPERYRSTRATCSAFPGNRAARCNHASGTGPFKNRSKCLRMPRWDRGRTKSPGILNLPIFTGGRMLWVLDDYYSQEYPLHKIGQVLAGGLPGSSRGSPAPSRPRQPGRQPRGSRRAPGPTSPGPACACTGRDRTISTSVRSRKPPRT